MKDFKQHILEKLKVSTKHTIVKPNACLVRLDLFIPWLYEYRYHALDDLDAMDLNHPDAPFKSELKKYFSDNDQKLFNFFYDNAYGDNNIIEVESIEEYPGAWEFEFTIDNITFKTHKKFRWPLNEWKTKYPLDDSVDFIVNESKIEEKLKVSTKNSIDHQELFASVLDLLWHYGELDVKPLKLMCSYMHDNSHKIRSIDHIYYSGAPKSKKEWMMVTLDNDVSIRIDDFNAFNSLVFSKTGESTEEVLNKILYLMSN
jgi:hypothetical protein